MRVLIAEDHHILARTIATGLRREAIAVDLAGSGDVAERMCLLNDYDIIVLDRDLPVMSGDEVCLGLRALKSPPRILMLTAAGSVADRVSGLDLGADDYLAKPFDFAELIARIRALSRRVPAPPLMILRHGGIELDRSRREVRIDGRPVELSPKEFAVLQLLMEARGEAVTHRALLDHVWDENMDSRTSAVRATVSRLRGKLGRSDAISIDDGKGYRLC
ncbi:response regulator transcription factor [Streptomyces rugosispiralis]|uniref:Response regulator transcription factor n=1 Tax=Streptomyces rugosispiralis TaxID=2967341 RepID=A0ABT1V9U7_9ACTN|nr:response regulator transcription factor [Streptomyces rugosispiralis]MCQ8193559.1 response regulator transcription factor [Streptomyces rugosispiralis]